MARIRIESLARPEEELTGTQAAKVVGAGYGYWGVGYPAVVGNGYWGATPYYNPVYAALGGTSIGPGFGPAIVPGYGPAIGPGIGPAIVPGFGGPGFYGPFQRW